MFPIQIPKTASDEFSRCEERGQLTEHGKNLSPAQKADMSIKEDIYQAFWKDDILRATDYYEIDVNVKNGIVYLSGHVLSTTSQSRVENAIQSIADIKEVKNNLVLDDELTLKVSMSLGGLEHTHNCKFFTGVSHGVVSLNGTVTDENIRLLAEKRAANNPDVRGVINNLRVAGDNSKLRGLPFIQPVIGEIIYFIDGAYGVVKQVIINPNNRRVVAMIVLGKFTDQRYELNSQMDDKAQFSEQLITVPMNVVRHMTRVSGFLHIGTNETTRYKDFDPVAFMVPNKDWIPPYPYCLDDVLIPVKYQREDRQAGHESDEFPFGAVVEDASVREQYFANDSFGL